jgi:hypothetical protein
MFLCTQARSVVSVGQILLLSCVIEKGTSHRVEREFSDSVTNIECVLNRGRLTLP